MAIKSTVIAGIGSDIGTALASRWLDRGWRVAGTYRSTSKALDALAARGAQLVRLDMNARASFPPAAAALGEAGPWDVLVLAAASMEPIGPFSECDFARWAGSIEINFINQLGLLHALLRHRRRGADARPLVLMFAGGGTNGAPVNYSAYTVSKIALIKMCELLDAEMPDVRFVILGPGWVRTKIHRETIRAGERAGGALEATRERMALDRFNPMERVVDCCDWALETSKHSASGRNFSVVHDAWGSPELDAALAADADLYKLRRSGNAGPERPVRSQPVSGTDHTVSK